MVKATEIEREARGLRIGAWCLAAIAVVLVTGMLFGGCADPAQADAAIKEWHSRTVAAMEAADVDPAEADDAMWKQYGAAVATEMLSETGGLPEPEPAPAQDWLGVGLDVLMMYLGVKGVTLGGQYAAHVVTGRENRGSRILATIASGNASWPETVAAVGAGLLDWKEPAASVPKPSAPSA